MKTRPPLPTQRSSDRKPPDESPQPPVALRLISNPILAARLASAVETLAGLGESDE